MKKLIISSLFILFIVLVLFFLSFFSYSEDNACVVLLNSFKEGIVFEDIVFLEADNAKKCNKNNTLILPTLKDDDVLKFAVPMKVKRGNVSFFVSAIIPEKHNDDIPMEHRKDDEKLQQGEHHFKTSFPDSKSDFVIYYLYNDPDSSTEDLEAAFSNVQKNRVNLILTGNFDASQRIRIRPQLEVFPSLNKPETGVLVFSIVRLEEGEKKVIIRSFNRRSI